MHIEGMIARKETKTFVKECKKIGWTVVSVTHDKITYLDKQMNRHAVLLGDKTAYFVVGG